MKKYYSPRISRFLVSVLYHQARSLKIPMTILVDQLLSNGLKGSAGWEEAETCRVAEEAPTLKPTFKVV